MGFYLLFLNFKPALLKIGDLCLDGGLDGSDGGGELLAALGDALQGALLTAEVEDGTEVDVEGVEHEVKHLEAVLVTCRLHFEVFFIRHGTDVLVGVVRHSLGDEACTIGVGSLGDSYICAGESIGEGTVGILHLVELRHGEHDVVGIHVAQVHVCVLGETEEHQRTVLSEGVVDDLAVVVILYVDGEYLLDIVHSLKRALGVVVCHQVAVLVKLGEGNALGDHHAADVGDAHLKGGETEEVVVCMHDVIVVDVAVLVLGDLENVIVGPFAVSDDLKEVVLNAVGLAEGGVDVDARRHLIDGRGNIARGVVDAVADSQRVSHHGAPPRFVKGDVGVGAEVVQQTLVGKGTHSVVGQVREHKVVGAIPGQHALADDVTAGVGGSDLGPLNVDVVVLLDEQVALVKLDGNGLTGHFFTGHVDMHVTVGVCVEDVEILVAEVLGTKLGETSRLGIDGGVSGVGGFVVFVVVGL